MIIVFKLFYLLAGVFKVSRLVVNDVNYLAKNN